MDENNCWTNTMELEEIINLFSYNEGCSDEKSKQLRSLKRIVRESREYNLDLISVPYYLLTKIAEACPELEWLDLRYTNIADLHPLSYLKELRVLWLENTKVHDLYPISVLNDLEDIRLDDTQIQGIECLTSLTKLKKLRVTNTAVRDLSPLSNLNSLEVLWLDGTPIQDIMPLGRLKKLKTLSLNRTGISDLIALSAMDKLETLYLIKTPVCDLHQISMLHSLTYLWLDETQVHSIEPLHTLTALKFLSLRNNHLDNVPAFCFEREMEIQLSGSTIARQPEALFQLPRGQILESYYNQPKISIREGKVIFVGDSGVGKTYTIKRIMESGRKKDYKTDSTPGIDIQAFACDDGISIRFWDFGGQEIMQSMHRLFLTERTCYVVTISNRDPQSAMPQARRWLRALSGFSNKISVLLAVNQWYNTSAEWNIDPEELKHICSQLSSIIFYSAADDSPAEFNQKITHSILNEVRKLDSMRLELPLRWVDIRRELLNMSANYITLDMYRNVCARHGLGETDKNTESIRMWLLDWFNDIGVCFSYHKNAEREARELLEYKVLRPTWLTNGIYRIINNGISLSHNGVLSKPQLLMLLNDKRYYSINKRICYSREELEYILEVMRKFQYSYRLSNNKEFVPSVLSGRRPYNIDPVGYGEPLVYTVKLTYLSLSLIHRLMISMREWINGPLWRYGVQFKSDDCVVSIEANEERNLLVFKVYQQTCKNDCFCVLFHKARRSILLDCNALHLAIERETISMRKEESYAEYELYALIDHYYYTQRATSPVLPNQEGRFRMFSFDELLYPLFSKKMLDMAESLKRKNSLEMSEALSVACTAFLNGSDQTEHQLAKMGENLEWRTQ